jgi:hypothetical protein
MNNWQKLCMQVNSLIKKGVDEDLFHLQFESYLKTIFDWDESSIKHKPTVQIGRERKEADIVLTGNDFGIVIEMKRPNIILGSEEADQLTSYMRILKYRYGFLISNMVKVFYDDDIVGAKPIEVASFYFDEKNSDGMELSDILDKSVCSNEKLREYVFSRKQKQKTEQEDPDKEPSPNSNIISEFNEKCIIIKIRQENVNKNNGDIYNTVRRCWRNNINRAKQADYVMAVVNGQIIGVFQPNKWYYAKEEEGEKCIDCTSKNKQFCRRIGFIGNKADDYVQNKYLGKYIPEEYRRRGMAAPFLFTY